MTDVYELRRLARDLADLYATLAELRWTPRRTPAARKMKPVFGPMSPEPDNDFSLNLEHELMRETKDQDVPGGLRSMALDALQYTTANIYPDNITPGILCAHIYRHADTIARTFPAADELAELLQAQAEYLAHQIKRQHGNPQAPPPEQATGYGTAADLAPLASAILGREISRHAIRYWARSGRITQHLTSEGTAHYQLAEVIAAARTYTDQRTSTS